MALVQVQELIDAGVHYGHRASKWNPRMRPYIYGKRNLIHIIDLRETVKGLIRVTRFLQKVSAQGSLVLFVGTKRQAQESIIRESQRCFMPYVSERWIGGTFTNFRTIRSRLQRLTELEGLIQTGEINAYSKKRKATLLRELKKVRRNLSGMRTMNRLPGAVVVVDAKNELTALTESRKMNIPTAGLIDTDSDPNMVDLAVPGNDDSIRSIDIIVSRFADAVLAGLSSLPKEQVDRFQGEFTKTHQAAAAILQQTEEHEAALRPEIQELEEKEAESGLADESKVAEDAEKAEDAAVEKESREPVATGG